MSNKMNGFVPMLIAATVRVGDIRVLNKHSQFGSLHVVNRLVAQQLIERGEAAQYTLKTAPGLDYHETPIEAPCADLTL